MRTKTTIIIIMLIVLAAIAAGAILSVTLLEGPAANLTTPSTVYVTAENNSSVITMTMKKGDLLNVTVRDHSDGGYVWSIVSIDNMTLRPDAQFMWWGSSGNPGDFGKDTFMFTALKNGNTTLSLECKRPWEQEAAQEFDIQITIK